MTVRTGDEAPGFQLSAKPGEVVDVGAEIGRSRVVLFFFPLSFSSTCTSEMGALRDDWQRWQELDAKVYGVTVDSPFVTDRFRRDERVPFPILSDFNREVARRYGVQYDDLLGLKGVPKRAVFVIGRDGRVAYDWVSEDAGVEPPYDDVRAALAGA